MSFFDFFFPQVAQATHLRSIAETQREQMMTGIHHRFNEEKQRRFESSRSKALEHRVEELEKDLGQAGLIIESLIQLLEESGTIKREDIAKKALEVDAADGVIDGKLSSADESRRAKPFLPNRNWDDLRK